MCMLLSEYLRQLSKDERQALAQRVSEKASVGYLYLLAGGHRNASPARAQKIEAATDGAVTRHDLRPDIFGPAPREREAA